MPHRCTCGAELNPPGQGKFNCGSCGHVWLFGQTVRVQCPKCSTVGDRVDLDGEGQPCDGCRNILTKTGTEWILTSWFLGRFLGRATVLPPPAPAHRGIDWYAYKDDPAMMAIYEEMQREAARDAEDEEEDEQVACPHCGEEIGVGDPADFADELAEHIDFCPDKYDSDLGYDD